MGNQESTCSVIDCIQRCFRRIKRRPGYKNIDEERAETNPKFAGYEEISARFEPETSCLYERNGDSDGALSKSNTKTKPGYTRIKQADLDKERAETKSEIKYQEEIAHFESEKTSLSEQIRRLKQERDDALSRLSELMSLNLRDGNPNIVDLSDEYRPNKLAELSSELYDNEWTNAYEFLETNFEVGVTSEKQRIQFLLDVLLEIFEFCKTVCRTEWENMVTGIFGGKAKIETEQQKMLKDMRKKHAEERLPDIEKQCLEELELLFESHNSCFKAESVLDYMKACVKLCWLMQFQDPPVVFVCPGWKSSHILSTVSPETCSQSYNVQSPTKLDEGEKENENNPLPGNSAGNVCNYEKTIRSGTTEDEKETVITSGKPTESSFPEETQGNGNDEEEKATECSKEKRSVFDRCLFKEFTEKGKFIDFIVWPTMYLHEGGPILNQGVAQGCD